ncbi:MAG: hypothetical protein A2066_00280 [Bacteroidetes bacterium GWB2_41_8]|nr:MAG: hypothetical protein A2066_00280 [Bacteroidetes bacterium GWB2_41_8]
MKITLKRIAYRPTYTIGKLYIDGKYFCDTLEDTKREVKIMHETCIPAGSYQVTVNMSNRFKRLMPLLLNVPGFEGIRIHNGSTAAHTSGCILVGKNSIVGQLTESKATFENLFKLLQSTKDKITIEIS